MTIIVDTFATVRSLHVAKRGELELRAVIDGRNVYAQVTDARGFIQYPAWNPIDLGFEMWESIPEPSVATMIENAWSNAIQHPSLQFAAN